jgi:soluble cytochrome b562
MSALYTLAGEYLAACEALAELDIDPQTLADTLESLSGDLETKAINVAKFARNLEAMAVQIKDAEKAMAERRKSIEKKADAMRAYLLHCMLSTEINKIECPYFALTVKKNPPAVIIEDEAQVPARFMRQPEPPPPAVDKKAIAEAIKAGENVPGARVAAGFRLDIK